MTPSIRYLDGRSAPVGTIFCIARNYAAHISELGNSRPPMPVIFCKPLTALNFDEEIALPAFSQDIHYETELVVHLGRGGKNLDQAQARTCIGGYALGLDLTARDLQETLKNNGWPWEAAKGFDGAACVSDFIAAEALPDPADIRFSMQLNGRDCQNGHTALMLLPIVEQIAWISRHFTLRGGDLLFTGTPEGVGRLQPGDRLNAALHTTPIFKNWKVIS